MLTRLIDKLLEFRFSTLIVILLFVSFSPYLFFDFGFHNDYTIWAYNNKDCCSGFPENSHLINVGRFLQAYLQGMYLWFFTDLHSLVYGRAAGLIFACIGAILLATIARKNGMDKFSSAAFGAAVFLLPLAQVNLGWVTNFVPGLFNAVLVLYATLIFPDLQSVLNKNRRARIKVGICALLLLSSLFNYPPTIGFFLIPVMIRMMYKGFTQRQERLQVAYAFVFFAAVCVTYFVLHRFVFMPIFDIVFPASSFYRFDISPSIFNNIIKFFLDIAPAMLNVWNPAPSLVVALGVFVFVVAQPILMVYKNYQTTLSNTVIKQSVIFVAAWFVLFMSMNSPGLLAIGEPPSFYRTWHPGMAAVLLLLFYNVDLLRSIVVKKSIIIMFLIIGGLFSFNSSMHLSSVLSKQFKYALSQINSQFSPTEREHYLLIEKRPESSLFGHSRWGELGFIHILSRGHAIYILREYFNHNIHPIVESIVVQQSKNEILIEADLLEKSQTYFPRSPADAINLPFATAFDFRIDTYFEKSGPMPVVMDIVGTKSASVTCYRLHAGIDASPARAPRSWRLTGSNDGEVWTELDRQFDQVAWQEGASRLFVPKHTNERYLRYRLEVDESNQPGFTRVSQLQLYTRKDACQETILLDESGVDPVILKSLASISETMPVKLAGMATQSGLSDPPFRLQRALDNIYYTFWETLGHFPLNVKFKFFENKQIKCYSLQSGGDKANHRMPRSWRFMGTNDGVNWKTLDTRSDENKWTDNERRIFKISTFGEYRSYQIEFLSVNGGRFFRLYNMALSEDSQCNHSIP